MIRRYEGPSTSKAFEVVSPKIQKAAERASKALKDAGIRHMLVGGLAVGAHGYPRTTKDVDFIVGEEAFDHHGGGLVTVKSGIPVAVGDVPIDLLSVGDDGFIEDDLDEAWGLTRIPIAPIDVLIYLKLKSPRRRDKNDVIALIQAGADTDVILGTLTANAPELIEKFRTLIDIADSEYD